MNRLAVTLALAALSLGFAPAPFPRTQARPTVAERGRLLAQRKARLEELKVDWSLGEYDGRPAVYFKAAHPGGNRAMGSVRSVTRGDLAATLAKVIEAVERYHQGKG